MNTSAIVAMLLIGSFVWGGFIFLLARGIRTEKKKANGDDGR